MNSPAFGAGVDAVARAQPFREQMPQITFAREVFGGIEDRIMQLAEFDLEIAACRPPRACSGPPRASRLNRAFISSAERR